MEGCAPFSKELLEDFETLGCFLIDVEEDLLFGVLFFILIGDPGWRKNHYKEFKNQSALEKPFLTLHLPRMHTKIRGFCNKRIARFGRTLGDPWGTKGTF